MRLHAIEVRSVRKLRPGCRIEGLGPGLNVIGGDNEEGKSSLLLALKCAFFLSHTATGALRSRLVPLGTGETPEIDVDLEVAGKAYALKKAFRRDGVTLATPEGTLRGAEAESQLEQLLGFNRPGRAPSEIGGPQMGNLGLFWIDQGRAFDGVEPTGDDQKRLSALLAGEIDNAIAGESGDAIIDAAEQLFSTFWTDTGRELSSGALARARTGLDGRQAAFDELDGRVRALDDKLDRLTRDREERQRLHRENAEARAQEKLTALRQRIAEATKRGNELSVEREATKAAILERQALEGRRDHRVEQSAAVAAMARDIALKRGERDEIAARVATIEAEAERLRQAQEAASTTHKTAREELRSAERRAEADAARERLKRLRQQIAKAEAIRERLAQAMAELAGNGATPEALRKLRVADRALGDAQVALEVVATRIELRPQAGRDAAIDGRPHDPARPLDLVEPTVIQLDGYGAIRVLPGGGDIAERRATLEQRRSTHALLLEGLAVASLDAAQEKAERRTALQAEIERLEAESAAILGGDGLDFLRAEAAALGKSLAADAGAPPASDEPLDIFKLRSAVEEAEAALDALQKSAGATGKRLNDGLKDRQVADSLIASLHSRHDTAQARLAADEQAEPLVDLEAAVAKACARESELAARCARLELALDAESPALLHEQAQMLERSLGELATARRKLDERIVTLEGEIRGVGGEGIGERRNEAKAALDDAAADLARIEREAKAAKLLRDTLQEERRRSRDAFTGPIRARLEPLLQAVLPQAAGAVIDPDKVTLARLARPGGEEELAELSIGTREQLSVLVRLAFAELLLDHGAEAPPLILDDALVYADEARFDRMKLLLQRMARRLQIIILTCRPRDYLGLDAKTFRLEDCRL